MCSNLQIYKSGLSESYQKYRDIQQFQLILQSFQKAKQAIILLFQIPGFRKKAMPRFYQSGMVGGIN